VHVCARAGGVLGWRWSFAAPFYRDEADLENLRAARERHDGALIVCAYRAEAAPGSPG
jgi:hypothetical protein